MCARLQAEMAAEAARVAAAYVHTEMRTAGGYAGGGQKPALARPTTVAQVRARVRVRVRARVMVRVRVRVPNPNPNPNLLSAVSSASAAAREAKVSGSEVPRATSVIAATD